MDGGHRDRNQWDTQRVAMIARSKGVKPSAVYRGALDYYLAAHA